MYQGGSGFAHIPDHIKKADAGLGSPTKGYRGQSDLFTFLKILLGAHLTCVPHSSFMVQATHLEAKITCKCSTSSSINRGSSIKLWRQDAF